MNRPSPAPQPKITFAAAVKSARQARGESLRAFVRRLHKADGKPL